MSRVPKNRIPRELTAGLFRPELIDRHSDLNDFVREAYVPVKDKDVKRRVANRAQGASTSDISTNTGQPGTGIPVPLTEAEAEEADRQILNTIHRISAAKEKINYVRDRLDSAIVNLQEGSQGGKELSFVIDVSKKPRVKRAIRKLFGEKRDTITYTMYKDLLKAKFKLEKQEVKDFADGKTKDKKEKKSKKEDED